MEAFAFYLKMTGLVIWLGNILYLNIGTYASNMRKGCWFYERFHQTVRDSYFASALDYQPDSLTFRSIHALASGILTAGAIISWLPGFIVLNAGGFVFAVLPPSTFIERFSSTVNRLLSRLLVDKRGMFVSLIVVPIVFSLPALFSPAPFINFTQLSGAALLLIWYFSCFGGYWAKTTTVAVVTFFTGILLLFISAVLAGPPAYPFAVLEGLAALMQGFFLIQEIQWLSLDNSASKAAVIVTGSENTQEY